jgi:hypothetical protein
MFTYKELIDYYNKQFTDNPITDFQNNEMTTVYYFKSGSWVDQQTLQEYVLDEDETLENYGDYSIDEVAYKLYELGN